VSKSGTQSSAPLAVWALVIPRLSPVSAWLCCLALGFGQTGPGLWSLCLGRVQWCLIPCLLSNKALPGPSRAAFGSEHLPCPGAAQCGCINQVDTIQQQSANQNGKWHIPGNSGEVLLGEFRAGGVVAGGHCGVGGAWVRSICPCAEHNLTVSSQHQATAHCLNDFTSKLQSSVFL
jgi:hypothetical protein